jgi:hypothetical protein
MLGTLLKVGSYNMYLWYININNMPWFHVLHAIYWLKAQNLSSVYVSMLGTLLQVGSYNMYLWC